MVEDHSTEYLETKKRYADMVKDLEEYEGWTDEINYIINLLKGRVTFYGGKLSEEEMGELNGEKSYCEEQRAELERAICERYGVKTPAELERKIQELEPEIHRLEQLVQTERRQRWKETPLPADRASGANLPGVRHRKRPVCQNGCDSQAVRA